MPASQITVNSELVHEPIAVRSIAVGDVFDALAQGATDFWRHPSHYIFLALLYPIVGIVLAVWSAGGATYALLYPLATGFALLGPIAALGLYELSRRREQGFDDSPHHAFAVLRHPAIGAMCVVGVMLALVFLAWLASAAALFDVYFGGNAPEGLFALITATLTTQQGWGLLIVGNIVGLCFALLVLATSAIAFPLLVDRGGDPGRAIATSVRAFTANPIPMLAWGLLVAMILFIASIPLFVGLALALPILGHATWHLYRKLTG